MRRLAGAVMFAGGVLAAGVLLAADPAAAHAELVELTPADGTVIDGAPAVVAARFDAELDAENSVIEVVDVAGTVVARGGLDLDDPEHTRLVVGMPGTARRGAYTVRWEAESVADGHVVTGDASFAVGPADALDALDDGGNSRDGWVSIVTVLAVSAVVATAIVAAGLRSGPPSSGGGPRDDEDVLA